MLIKPTITARQLNDERCNVRLQYAMSTYSHWTVVSGIPVSVSFVWLEIVWSSLQRAIEPTSTNQGNLEMDLWKSYTELWLKLIDTENATPEQQEKGSEDVLCLTGIQQKISDAMFVCLMKVLRELNLKYRVKRTRRPDTENAREGIYGY